jgi:3-methyladenine DNA glycosylase AlkC
MAALKDLFDKTCVKRIGLALSAASPSFDLKSFQKLIPALETLEMKPRVLLIRDGIHAHLPANYKKAVEIILSSTGKGTLRGFDLWPFTEFIQAHGLEDRPTSLNALKKLTILFTGEFGVRPFIREHQKETLDFLLTCAADKNVHVRRWATEGSRPRLPWGEKLHGLVKDPRPTLPILELLKFDEELYVRKSVANHLNDIAKDHPELVIKTLGRWKKEARGGDLVKLTWVIRHALRTLIKEGNPEALKLLGVSQKIHIKATDLKLDQKSYKLGERMSFSFDLESPGPQDQKIVVDYIVHFMKANRSLSGKVFKLKTFTLRAGEKLKISKTHHLKQITTRVFHPGLHELEIQINGKVYLKKSWDLVL